MLRVSYSDMPDRNLPTMRQRRKVRSKTSDAAISVTSSPMSSEASRPSGYFPSTTSSSPGKAGEYFGSDDGPHSGMAVSPACSAASRSTWLRSAQERTASRSADSRREKSSWRMDESRPAISCFGSAASPDPCAASAARSSRACRPRHIRQNSAKSVARFSLARSTPWNSTYRDCRFSFEEPQPIVLRRAGDDVRDFLDPGDHRFVAAEGIVRAPLDDQVRERGADAGAEFLVEPLHDREDADRRHDRQRHREGADEVEPVPPEISKRDQELIHSRPGKPEGHGLKA